MGRQVRIDDALRPAVLKLREAYECRKITADDVNAMVCYLLHGTADDDAAAEDEGVSEGVSLPVSLPVSLKEENENKERTKENKEKEESPSSSSEKRNLKKKFNSNALPLLEDVEAYHKELGITEFTAEEFFDYYETYGWLSKGGSKIVDWKSKMRSWKRNYNRYTNRKSTHNVTNTNQQRQAAGAGAQAAGAAAREEHRKEDLEKHLASHHPGDDRLAKLAREIDEVAQEVGVPTTEYTLQQIAYDAQALLYRMVFCEGWTDEKWLAAMAYVKGQMTRKGAKRLGSSTLLELVYEFSKIKNYNFIT